VPAVAAALGDKGASSSPLHEEFGTVNGEEFLSQSVLPKFQSRLHEGRNNYLCLHRLGRAEDSPVLEGSMR